MAKRKTPTLSASIQQKLMDDIMEARISPGMRLEETELAERYNVSRTPVREALRLLAATGVVELRPRRGMVIASLTPAHLEEMIEVAADMEASAARYAAQRMTKAERYQLAQAYERLSAIVQADNPAEFDRQNRELHRLVWEGAHNTVLLESIERMRVRILPYTRVEFMQHRSRMAVSHSQHDVFVQAILGGHAEAAYFTMRFHVMSAGKAPEDLPDALPETVA
jgi:DNA-binding GntR family transcriptional regulator